LTINLEAPILRTRAVVPGMLAREAGRVHQRSARRVPLVAGRLRRLLVTGGVASVTVSCIVKDRPEVIVNTPPVRPVVVLANLAQGIVPRLMKLFGCSGVFERVIAAEKAQ
jgi:hypothetical protein